MLDVRVANQQLHIGRLVITFHRTLRIPDDGRDYPLPPSLGHFPVNRVEDFAATVPAAWKQHGGIFLPMYQREALWLRFEAPDWHPLVLKVAMGMVNALTGKPWAEGLSDAEQDYLVCPPQPWLDGMKTEHDIIRQFVAMPLGMGYTAEGQLTGQERFGGLQTARLRTEARPLPESTTPPRTPVRIQPQRAIRRRLRTALLAVDLAMDAVASSAPSVAPRRLQAKGAEWGWARAGG